jgi:hypothetical protein
MIALLMASSFHFGIAVHLTTERADEKTDTETQYKENPVTGVDCPPPIYPNCHNWLIANILDSINNCSPIRDPQCNIKLKQFFQLLFHNADILRSIYKLDSTYNEQDRRNSYFGRQSDLNNVNTETTQDLNETQQISTASRTVSQDYDGTTDVNDSEQRETTQLHNSTTIHDEGFDFSSTAASVSDTSQVTLTENNDIDLHTESPETRSGGKGKWTPSPLEGGGHRR